MAGGIDAILYFGSTQPAGVGDSILATFTNTYNPEDADLYDDSSKTIIFKADKTIVGRDMKSGEKFEFALEKIDIVGNKIVAYGTVENAKNGIAAPIVFTEAYKDALVIDAAGSYTYHLYETTADANGLTTDKTVYQIVVTVTDEGGKLNADYIITNIADDSASFVNRYTVEKAEHAVKANKVLDGKTLLDSEFAFTLSQADSNFNIISGGKVYTATNTASGEITFETLEFTEVGEHYFVLEETKGDEVTFIGEKLLEGRDIKDGEFTFELFETNENYKIADNATALQSKKNDQNGIFTFDKIEYTQAGTHYYVIREFEDKSIERVTFDKTEYKIEVVVKDNLDGTLTASYKLVDTEAEEIAFKNIYTPAPEPQPEPEPDTESESDPTPTPDYEPKDEETTTPEPAPNTGENNRAYNWIIIFVISMGAVMVLFPRKKRAEVK